RTPCRWRRARSTPSRCRTRTDGPREPESCAQASPGLRSHPRLSRKLCGGGLWELEVGDPDIAVGFVSRHQGAARALALFDELPGACERAIAEQPLALTEHDGGDHQHQPVQQAAAEQLRVERRAALDDEIGTVLLLERRD